MCNFGQRNVSTNNAHSYTRQWTRRYDHGNKTRRTMEYPAQASNGDHTNTTELVIEGKRPANQWKTYASLTKSP